MGLGVLEPKSGEKVPGTVHVERLTREQRELTANLKHGTGKDEHIVLVPQPSDSPNDPLNWSRRTKLFHSWFLAVGTGLGSGTCYFLNPSHAAMAKIIGTSVVTLSRSLALLMLCMGIASVLTSPLARIWGKRPVFIGLSLLGLVGYGIILSDPKSMTYIWAGRALWGAGASGLEYLVSSSVGDLFFVHQRGFHLALWHFALAGGNSAGQVIASQIVQGQGYVWAFRYAEIFMAIYTVGLFFLLPESNYNRPSRYDTDVKENLVGEADAVDLNHSNIIVDDKDVSAVNLRAEEAGQVSPQETKKSYWSTLKLYNGRFSEENFLLSLFSPFVTLLLPGVSWAAYSYGTSVAFSAGFSVSLATTFSGPPYHFKTSSIGLTVLAPFVANIFGNYVPGTVADWLVKYMSKKNNGVYEPEFRNLLCIPAFLTSIAGYWGYGLAVHNRVHWFGPVFLFGLAAFGGSIVSLISNTYLLDCHRKHAQDAYAIVTLVKGVLTFTVAFTMNSWLARRGPVEVFFVLGSLHGSGCLFGLVLYVYGKRIRLWVHKNTFIQSLLERYVPAESKY